MCVYESERRLLCKIFFCGSRTGAYKDRACGRRAGRRPPTPHTTPPRGRVRCGRARACRQRHSPTSPERAMRIYHTCHPDATGHRYNSQAHARSRTRGGTSPVYSRSVLSALSLATLPAPRSQLSSLSSHHSAISRHPVSTSCNTCHHSTRVGSPAAWRISQTARRSHHESCSKAQLTLKA